MTDRPTVIAIFGVTGDLARRKLIPSLYSNFIKGRLPERLRIVGVGRREWTDATLIDHAHQSLQNYASAIYDENAWQRFRATLSYSKVNLPQPETYQTLKNDLEVLDGGQSNRLYYLSIAPEYYADVIRNLGALDLARENGGWRRIVIEKPFGYDLSTAQSLNQVLHSVFNESQVYRIDHYLGKETGAEHPLHALCQHHLRAHLESQSYQQCASDGGGNGRCRHARRLLRQLGRHARYDAEPPAAVAFASRHGAAIGL